MKTEKELKQLALDVIEGKVFTDRHCQNDRDIPMVFMILGLLGKEDIKHLQEKDPVLFYEYMDKANPRSINGMPIFLSFQFLTKEEGNIYFPLIKKLVQQREEFLGNNNETDRN